MSVVFLQTIGVNLMMGERALVPNGLRERSMKVGSDGHGVLSPLPSLWQHTCSIDLIISSLDFEIQYSKTPWARAGRNQRSRSELIGSWEADYSCVVDCCRAFRHQVNIVTCFKSICHESRRLQALYIKYCTCTCCYSIKHGSEVRFNRRPVSSTLSHAGTVETQT